MNCHTTGAVTVEHDTMATNHAEVIRDQGNTACAYCHQPVYCARCHKEPVLPVTTPFLQGSTILPSTATTGVSWPLKPQELIRRASPRRRLRPRRNGRGTPAARRLRAGYTRMYTVSVSTHR